jgi:multidrug efflux pump subunit AcrA (membrane-fusion protein)
MSTCRRFYSPGLKPGMTADLTFNELPGKKFTGKLVRTSRQIDPTSRTLLVEFDVDNRSGELFPGPTPRCTSRRT